MLRRESPLSLEKPVYLDGQRAVLYRSRMNPSLGRNFEAMDSLEWLARRADQAVGAAMTSLGTNTSVEDVSAGGGGGLTQRR